MTDAHHTLSFMKSGARFVWCIPAFPAPRMVSIIDFSFDILVMTYVKWLHIYIWLCLMLVCVYTVYITSYMLYYISMQTLMRIISLDLFSAYHTFFLFASYTYSFHFIIQLRLPVLSGYHKYPKVEFLKLKYFLITYKSMGSLHFL